MLIVVILLLVVIFILIYPYIVKFKNKESSPHHSDTIIIDNKNNSIDYKQYYKPKTYVITLNELKFYNVLLEIAKELDLILFSQVSLYNIIKPKDNLDYKTRTIFFNKIASKTIDFVLVDKTNCKIRLCIELDDSTHKQEKRIQRDKFINELFNSLNIKLLRYNVYPVYYKETLKKRIQECMNENSYIN